MARAEELRERYTWLERQMSRVLLGLTEQTRLAMACFLARGHLLIEDVPGTGKTTFAKTFARLLNLQFRRIQMTPDLLPSDLTGGFIYQPQEGAFSFRQGPVFTNVLMADEINRASPRTQSALLEVMEEHQVTVEGQTFPLEEPFFVVATQNPVEYQGVYRLPEAQLDRFTMRIRFGYLPREEERNMLLEKVQHPDTLEVEPVFTREEILSWQQRVPEVRVHESLAEYVVELGAQTRRHPGLFLGASPRALLTLLRVAQAWALLEGRDFVVPDDIRSLWLPCVAHRVHAREPGADYAPTEEAVLREILEAVPVPAP